MYRLGAKPPHILPKMIPRSMFGVNLRALIPEEWKRISWEFRENFGHRCQVCGGAPVDCHEDWEYIFDGSARCGEGVQRLRRLACLCKDCHALKHLGKTGLQGRTDGAMRHLAAVNSWPLQKAYEESDKAWADWELRNGFQWTIDVSFAEREYGVHIDASPERIEAIQRAADKKFARPPNEPEPASPTKVDAPVTPTIEAAQVFDAAVIPPPIHAPVQPYSTLQSAPRASWSGTGSSSSGPGCLGLLTLALFIGLGVWAIVMLSPSL
jgi:hypothetical protein